MVTCIDNITIDKIDFGSIEGKKEFDISNPQKIEYTFVHLKKEDIESLLNKTRYFIHGFKGTGKTSLIRYLDLQIKEKKNSTAFLILFKEAKDDPSIYAQIRKIMSNLTDDDLDMAALTFWRWFLLSYIAQQLFSYNGKFSIFHDKKDNIFYKLSGYMKTLINIAKPIMTVPVNGVEFSINGFDEDTALEDNEDIFEHAGVSLKYLELLFKKNLKQKIYILIDELDITINDTKQNKILVKNIIPASQHLNKIDNLHVIASIRSEVLSAVFNGNEINKLMEVYGVYMDWRDDKYTLSHPLMQVMLKKIKYSFITLCQNDKKYIEQLSDDDIFKRLFPESLLKDRNGVKNEQYILNTTWNKPRDIVRLFTIMSEKAGKEKFFTAKHFSEAMDTYSERAWEELSEEMTANFSTEQIHVVQSLFSNYQNCFTFNKFVTHVKQRKIPLDEISIKELLSKLYEIGFVVNHTIYHGKQVYKCSFRKDKSLDLELPIEVHRGLWNAFSSMKDTRYEILQQMTDDDSNVFNSLADQMRRIR